MKTKLCLKCNEEKDVSLFYIGKHKNPISPCKICIYNRTKLRNPNKTYPTIIDFKDEIWLPIIGYELRYHISNWGRVKSLNYNHSGQERILKYSIDKDGYYTMGLFDGKRQKTLKIHRLVGIHFIPNPLNLPEVNHRFGVKSDNRVSQLEWMTTGDNIRESLRIGLKVMPKGEDACNAKLSESQVLEIREIHKENKKQYRLTAEKYKVSASLISAIVNRVIWKHLP